MKKGIRILIIDDSIMFGEGLIELLEQNPIIDTIGHVTDEKLAYVFLASNHVDVILLDLNFDASDFDGFVIAKQVKMKYPNIKIIVITQHAKIDHYETLINNIGVDSYLDKRLSIRQLNLAIEHVIDDKPYVDPLIKKILDHGKWLKIRPREKEIIELLCKGYSQKLIANELFIEVKTVESHLRNARERYGFSNSAELMSEYINYKNAYREDYKNTVSPFRK